MVDTKRKRVSKLKKTARCEELDARWQPTHEWVGEVGRFKCVVVEDRGASCIIKTGVSGRPILVRKCVLEPIEPKEWLPSPIAEVLREMDTPNVRVQQRPLALVEDVYKDAPRSANSPWEWL